MDIEKGAETIKNAIEEALKKREGLLVGRNGTIEMEALFFKFYQAKPTDTYPSSITRRLELHAGVFPPTHNSVEKWVFQALESIRLSDILVAGWYKPLAEMEETFLNVANKYAPRIPLRSLEPYYVEPEKRWTQLLKGQKVAVVNAFAETAVAQTKKRSQIWKENADSLLPEDTTWIPIKTGYAPVLAKGRAEWESSIQSWDVAVTSTVKRVIESEAKIAIIGCGGLGMLIGAELRRRGIIAIVMGGATQVLFGIKGNRWASHDVISHFWNDAWVYPAEQETPLGSSQIEGGCYWGKN